MTPLRTLMRGFRSRSAEAIISKDLVVFGWPLSSLLVVLLVMGVFEATFRASPLESPSRPTFRLMPCSFSAERFERITLRKSIRTAAVHLSVLLCLSVGALERPGSRRVATGLRGVHCGNNAVLLSLLLFGSLQ